MSSADALVPSFEKKIPEGYDLFRFAGSDYDYRVKKMFVFGRNSEIEKKKFIISNFEPYYYCRKENEREHSDPKEVKIVKGGYITLRGEKMSKIVVTHPGDVSRLTRGKKRNAENKIKFPSRHLIDTKVKDYFIAPKTGGNINWDDLIAWDAPAIPIPLIKEHCDIEVYTGKDKIFPTPEKAAYPITIISNCYPYYDYAIYSFCFNPVFETEGKEVVEIDGITRYRWFFKTEKKMIETFAIVCGEMGADVKTGWNYLKFDLNYLCVRSEKIGANIKPMSPIGIVGKGKGDRDYRVAGCHSIDNMRLYSDINKPRKDSLEYCAKDRGLEGKKMKQEDINKNHRENFVLVVEYCEWDAWLSAKLDEIGDVTDIFEARRAVGSLHDIQMAVNRNTFAKGCFLRKFHGKYVFRVPDDDEIKKEKAKGAIVFDPPPPGKYYHVVVLDQKRFYPMIAISLNLSPEMVISEEEAELLGPNDKVKVGKVWIDLRRVGVVPQVMKDFLAEREVYETKLKQLEPGTIEWKAANLKVVNAKESANSIWGYLLYKKSVIYHKYLAESILRIARDIMKQFKRLIPIVFEKEQIRRGIKKIIKIVVLYGDTDSIFVQMFVEDMKEAEEIIDLLSEVCTKLINKIIQKMFKLKKHSFEVVPETIYNPVIFKRKREKEGTAKKNYIARVRWHKGKKADYVKYMGVAAKRRDCSDASKVLQENVAEKMLHEATKDEITDEVANAVRALTNKRWDKSFLIPSRMSKTFKEYRKPDKNGRKRTPTASVRAAEMGNRFLGQNIKMGMRYFWAYISLDKKAKERLKIPGGVDVLAVEDPSDWPDIAFNKKEMIRVSVENKVFELLEAEGINYTRVKNAVKIGGNWA